MKTIQGVYVAKSELAMLYAPELSPHAAVNRLMAWLKKDPDTIRALRATGYNKYQKILTPKQVAIITSFLGEP